MADCVIFCAGEFYGLVQELSQEDHIVAADGGLVHLQSLGITPDRILGDFDSLGYVPQGSQVFPVEKDDTDCMLAVRHGLLDGYRRFFIYGGMEGPRPDHTVANFQTLLYLSRNGATGYLIGEKQIATVLTRACVRFPADTQGTLSVFAMGGGAEVTLTGTKYPLEKGILQPDFPLGVSNRFLGQEATVRVTQGSVLILFPRDAGFPEIIKGADRP